MALTMKTFGRLTALIASRLGGLSEEFIEDVYYAAEEIAKPATDYNELPKINLVPLFNFIIQGEKISAIKEHRSLTGMGLRESKDEVEKLMVALGDKKVVPYGTGA